MLEERRASASGLANVGARLLRDAHAGFRDRHRAITRRAEHRFAARMWREMRDDANERIDLYSTCVDDAVERVHSVLGERDLDTIVWASLKAVYSGLHLDDPAREVAETFFNSVTRQVFCEEGVDPDIEFVHGDAEVLPAPEAAVFRRWEGTLEEQLQAILAALPFGQLWRDRHRDASRVAARLAGTVGSGVLETIVVPFYREQGAYVVGRLVSGGRVAPVVLCLRHPEGGIEVDAVVTDPRLVSILFGFTRSHFHVAAGPPAELVRFLRSILPHKRVAELYVTIGEYKHGKTELYRDLVDHLRATPGGFVPAPGTEGLVMVVFALEGFDMVFKVIRDSFGPPKQTTPDRVRDRYRFVFRNERAGRMVEAHEFEHLRIPRSRFALEVLDQLLRDAASRVRVEGDAVVIDHVYVERRVRPLDLHLASAPDATAALHDYARAIEELARTGVFCGDILPKNFGLTRNDRVVFYDYDEIEPVTEPVFRAIPEPIDPLDEMAAEPWFGHGPRDAFPEEWPPMLGLSPRYRAILETDHAELFDHRFWRSIQRAVDEGEPHEIVPYPSSARLDVPAPV